MTLEDSDRTLIVETLEGWWTTRRRRETRTEANTLLAKMRRLGISRPIHQEETDMLALAPAGIRREGAHLT